MEKKEIKDTLTEIDPERSLDGLITDLENYKKDYSKQGYYNFHIEKEYDYDYDGDHTYYELKGTRLETDEEFEKRTNKNKVEAAKKREQIKKRKKREEKKELEIYRKLYKKYEGNKA